MNTWRLVGLGLTAVLVVILVFACSLLAQKEISYSTLESINGIPYPPASNGVVEISEQLAHSDITVKQPVIAKALQLKVTFTPSNINDLRVGVRENPFWLSYPWIKIYSKEEVADPTKQVTKEITIPLTDKLQEGDRTVDLMFLADAASLPTSPEKESQYRGEWQLNDLKVQTIWQKPSLSELKDYVRSIIKQERAL